MRLRTGDMWGPTHLSPGAVGKRSKWGVIDRNEGERIVGPYTVQVLALLDVTTERLVEDSR